MHIPYIPQVFLPPRIRADRLFPAVDQFENAGHDGSRERRGTFGKPTNELIEELFRAYLQMEWISARLNESVKKGESQHGDMGISVIDESDGQHRGLPRPGVIMQMIMDPVARTTLHTYVLAFFSFT